MEWLKKLLGDENYNKLPAEILAMLKTSLGEVEYLPNDPTKIIPKHVFNEKLEEIKLLKAQMEQYKIQLKDVGNMITDTEVKTRLAEQELNFKTQIAAMEKNYKEQIETENKKHLITNYLNNNGAKHTDLLLNIIDLKNVIIQDGKLLNGEQILLPLKETYKTLFDVKLTPGILQNGTPVTPPTTKDALITKYNEFEKAGNFVEMERIRSQIKDLEQK